MGKNKGSKGKASNNVFKVAGARSLKIKNKAKQVAGQLKKLNQVTKLKTIQVDSQLESLHSTLMQQKPSVVAEKGNLKGEMQKMAAERAHQAEEHKKAVQDINRLSDSLQLSSK